MAISRIIKRLFIGLLVGFVIGGCTFPVTTSDEFQVFFGRPHNGDVIMVGETFQLLANGFSTAGDVTRVLFFANGTMVGEARNRAGGSIVASYLWTPSEAGQHTLQIAAQRGSEYAYSPTINICVLPFQIAPGHPYDIYSHGYEGDCVIPPRSRSIVSGSPTTAAISSSPQRVNYVPYFFSTCPDQTRFIDFKFYISDPGDDIVFAAIALSIAPALAGRINGETTLVLTHVGTTPPHTKLFAGRIDMHIFLARSLTEPVTGEGLSGELNWIARAFGRDGEILIEEGPFTIPVEPVLCDGSAFLPAVTPTLTLPASTLTPQQTSTPASALDCPPGTYYSEFTQKCYAIATPTKTPKNNDDGGGGENTCSQYGSLNACIAAGCTYNYNTKTCE